jgi:hypothetical protein
MAPLPTSSRNDALAILARAKSLIHTSVTTISSTAATLLRRQSAIIAIPASYSDLNSGPSPGAVAGIVLGSVAGFVLLLWLLYALFGSGIVVSEEGSVVVKERKRSNRTSSRRVSETVEVRRQRPRSPVVDRIVVEEERETRTAPAGSAEEIVVIEEHSPPRRSKSKRDSGYRVVDPMAYGGGDQPMRKSSSRRSRT